MNAQEFVDSLAFFKGSWGWIAQVFVIVLIAMTINFIQKRVLKKLHLKLTNTKNLWDDAAVEAARKPLSALIWIVGITFAAEVLQKETGAEIFSAFGPVRDVGVIATLTWFLIRLVRNLEASYISHRQEQNKKVDQTTVDAVGKLLRVSVLITATLVTLQTLGFSVSGVMAFGGIGGIAVGFAAKDILANFFGGLMIYLDRPFEVGDWIRSPDKEIEGTVEHIGWRLTRIRTFDKRPLYVPNSIFANISVENPSRMLNRRIYETIGIRYDDAAHIEAIVGDVEKMLREHPEIDTTQTLMVNFNKYAASSLDFFVYTFTKTTDWVTFHQIKQDVLLRIHQIIESHGAEVAFPTSTLHIADSQENPLANQRLESEMKSAKDVETIKNV
ncbi:MAG: mechanosensitive ion channel family protein [Gammaproteobacteria bacterium]|nr:mechanosensitive ion channel family protein [Gammaproteobacteria bacterium]MDH5693467.1 mechanosensitive ion channel family protein [Gammaproteobacteria bacterium]